MAGMVREGFLKEATSGGQRRATHVKIWEESKYRYGRGASAKALRRPLWPKQSE